MNKQNTIQQPTRQPKSILIYIPGSLQAIYDQSIEFVARQMTNACNQVSGANDYTTSDVEVYRLATGRELRRCAIEHRQNDQQDIVIVAANYTAILSDRLEQSGVTMTFLRLLWFWLSYTPLVCRIVIMRPRPGHTNLRHSHRVFVIGSYALVTLVLGTALAAVLELLGIGLPDDVLKHVPSARHVALAMLLVLGLLPAGYMKALYATGKEYYGLLRYLMKSERREEIGRYLDDVHADVQHAFPSVPVHAICFSFGCVIYFDYLFSSPEPDRTTAPDLASLSFIGFPYILIDACASGYFTGRRWLGGQLRSWWNYYTNDDFLGSKVGSYLPDIFGDMAVAEHHIKLEETAVVPQRSPSLRWNPAATHLAYWDPATDEACDTFRRIARMIARNPLGQPSPGNGVADIPG